MLHEPAKKRIAAGTISGEHMVQLLTDMAVEASEMNLESSHVIVSYIEEDDEFIPGTFVPEVHLVLRQVSDED